MKYLIVSRSRALLHAFFERSESNVSRKLWIILKKEAAQWKNLIYLPFKNKWLYSISKGEIIGVFLLFFRSRALLYVFFERSEFKVSRKKWHTRWKKGAQWKKLDLIPFKNQWLYSISKGEIIGVFSLFFRSRGLFHVFFKRSESNVSKK